MSAAAVFHPADHDYDPDECDVMICLDLGAGYEDDGDKRLWTTLANNEQVFDQYLEASRRLLARDTGDDPAGQVDYAAYFTLRQAVEIGLKLAICRSEREWPKRIRHSVGDLLGKLPTDHRLNDPADQQAKRLRSFIEELHEIDPGGDGGRYGTSLAGERSFNGWCHACADDLLEQVELVAEYLGG